MDEEALFAAALEKPNTAERQAFLDAACGGNQRLRNRVWELLSADAHARGILDHGATTVLALCRLDRSLVADETFADRFRLVRKLGEGGMGEVWVADQTDPVRRRVALKVVRPGLDSARLLARFEAERQALALMDHPNIAKVLDAGATDQGRPFFVMELVEGVPVTQFCDEHQLTPRQRLELFVPVCQAIQHAHQKGVIHRDLKPSNILVATYDGRPVPKVIDFGVAKATGPRLTDDTLSTEFGALIGTLEYMSPEQADPNSRDIDTRADVYALGVVLYEVLTGTVPFPRGQLQATPFAEMLRIIREVDPPKPSTRLADTRTAEGGTPGGRPGPPARVPRLYELDWIVMKCLEKDRSRRYESASALAADIERYLADEPVLAGPPSASYRVRKFLRRHRGPVIAAGLVLLALVGGVIGTTIGLLRAEARADGERRAKIEAERATEAERDARLTAERAGKEARESEADTKAFGQFLVDDVLSAPRPHGVQSGQGVSVTMRQTLQVAQLRLGTRFWGRPRAEAVARHHLGVTFRLLGEPKLAEPHLRRAVELRREVLGPAPEDTLDSQNSLGVVLTALRSHGEAVRLLDDSLRRRRATAGPDDLMALSCLDNLASAHRAAGQPGLAIIFHKEALARQTAVRGPDDPYTLNTMGHLAHAYQDAKQLGQAIPLYEELLRRADGRMRPEDPIALAATNNLGACYYAQRKWERALPQFEKAHGLQKAVLGADHPETITSLGNIAVCHQAAGRPDPALPRAKEALELQRAKLGPDSPDTLLGAYNLGLIYRDLRQPEEAAPLFEEAAVGAEKGGFTHEYAERMVRELIDIRERQGQYAEAEVWRRKWLPVIRKRDGEKSLSAAAELAFLGNNLLAQENYTDAETVLRECLEIREAHPRTGWPTANARSLVGAALAGQQNYAAAEPLLLSGYEGLRQAKGQIAVAVHEARLREAVERLVRLYDAWGKPAEAVKWRQELAGRQPPMD